MSKAKKLIAILLAFFFTAANNCYAFSALYYVKNIKTAEMEPIVENSYTSHKFNLVKRNPYYGTSSSDNDHAVIIIQQSGENMFYYYQSENNLKVNILRKNQS